MVLKIVVLFALFTEIYCERATDPRLVLKRMSATIGERVLVCREQTRFNEEIIDTFLSFWSPATPLDDPNMGCVVICVLKQLELLDSDSMLKHDNAAAFLSAKGSDEFTKEIIIELYELCKRITRLDQECDFGIVMAKCFRGGILMRNWTPDSLGPDAEDENYD